MPLPDPLACPVCLRGFACKAATLRHVRLTNDEDHQGALEYQVELAFDARFKGLSCQAAAKNDALWFGHDWISRLWTSHYGKAAAQLRQRQLVSAGVREHHRLYPDFNHLSKNRVSVGHGALNPFFGKTHSAEAKAKMSKVHRGKAISEEQLEKFREGHRRKYPTSEAFGAEVRARYESNPAAREKLREARLRQRFTRAQTQPELKVAGMLAALGYEAQAQVAIAGVGIVDFLVGRTIIEVFGDYWHANPAVYGEGRAPLCERQQTQRAKDAAKLRAYRDQGYETVVVWERDLKTRPAVCQAVLCDILSKVEDAELP